MNILVFSWRDPKHPLAGGAEQVMHEHMKGWIAAGHSVTLFSSHFKNGNRDEIIDGVNIIRRGIQYWGVHFLGALYYLFGKHEKYDLVIDQFHGIPFFTPLYVRVPKIAVLQEVAREVWLRNDLPSPFNKVIGIIGYWGEPFIFWFYKKVPFVVGSRSAGDDLRSMGIPEKNISIVPHGVIIDKSSKAYKKEKKKTVIFLGALARDKGIEDAIKTFSLLDKKGKYQFWIMGRCSPSYMKYLKKQVKLHAISDVTFWGFVSQKKKFELLSRGHVLVNPSLLEGFGLVNIEANAMKTPVVGYTSRGLIDSINHEVSGVLCHPNTPQVLAHEIHKLLSSPKRYQALQKGALMWSKEFGWKKAKKQSLGIIESYGQKKIV